jgi:hypothetical protein
MIKEKKCMVKFLFQEMYSSTKISDQKVQLINVPEDFEKFLLPQRQICCGPSMSGNSSSSM